VRRSHPIHNESTKTSNSRIDPKGIGKKTQQEEKTNQRFFVSHRRGGTLQTLPKWIQKNYYEATKSFHAYYRSLVDNLVVTNVDDCCFAKKDAIISRMVKPNDVDL
jgi:hypothetical protein